MARRFPTGFMEAAVPEGLGFAHSRLDRLANRRGDDAFISACLAKAEARFILAAGDALMIRPGAAATALFARPEAPEIDQASDLLFLGQDIASGAPVFAAVLPTATENPEAAMADDRAIIDLRAIANQGMLPPGDLGMLAEAKALSIWHRTHRHCSRCGALSVAATGGWKRVCTACGGEHFPRTDPVVIMLAVDGDRCLLGRQPRFPPGMYSALAGFLEPGETVEDAVRREIAEEAGIACGAVRYLGSQPWPFPMSLMIGCIAEATSTHIAIDQDELEDARWFTRAEAAAMIAGTHGEGLKAPHPVAIAHWLLRRFVDDDPCQPADL
jgi:NAD+ diphosphatase